MAWRTARSQSRLQQCPVTPWPTDAHKTWGESDQLGNEALPAENRGNKFASRARNVASSDAAVRRNNVGCIFAIRQTGSETREQRNAVWRTARAQRRVQQRPVTHRATDTKNTWGKNNRPGKEALPAENRETSFRVGDGTRTSFDTTAGRNAGRIFASRRGVLAP